MDLNLEPNSQENYTYHKVCPEFMDISLIHDPTVDKTHMMNFVKQTKKLSSFLTNTTASNSTQSHQDKLNALKVPHEVRMQTIQFGEATFTILEAKKTRSSTNLMMPNSMEIKN